MSDQYNKLSRKSESPFFSIITPTYNRASELSFAIESVLAQSFVSWEMIIVDNESTDNSAEIIDSFSDDRILRINVPRSGSIAKSRNAALSLARGEWITFLDSDDYWQDNKLSIVHSYTNVSDVLYHDVYLKDLNFSRQRKIKCRQVKKPVYLDLLRNGNALVNSATSVRTSLLRKIGGQNEDPKYFALEDYDCWLRLSLETENFVRIPKLLGTYVLHSSNSGSRNGLSNLIQALPEHLNNLGVRDRNRFYSLYLYYELRGQLKTNTQFNFSPSLLYVFRYAKFKYRLLLMFALVRKFLTQGMKCNLANSKDA